MREHEFEPVRGLPEDLPAGEEILWQGAPAVWRLACEAFHVRLVAAYLAAMLLVRAGGALSAGRAPAEVALAAVSAAPLAVVALALLMGLAWANSRATVYTVTNRRVVLRFGAAVPKAINIPFAIIAAADVRADGRGAGDVALRLTPENHIAYLHLWPHARPMRLRTPEPTMRAIPDARLAAEILGHAVARVVPTAVPACAPAVAPPASAPTRPAPAGVPA